VEAHLWFLTKGLLPLEHEPPLHATPPGQHRQHKQRFAHTFIKNTLLLTTNQRNDFCLKYIEYVVCVVLGIHQGGGALALHSALLVIAICRGKPLTMVKKLGLEFGTRKCVVLCCLKLGNPNELDNTRLLLLPVRLPSSLWLHTLLPLLYMSPHSHARSEKLWFTLKFCLRVFNVFELGTTKVP